MNKPPYLTFPDISDIIAKKNKKYPVLSDTPVDIEAFAELDLELGIVPKAGLRQAVKADAMITRDFQSILIDNDYYSKPIMHGRNRFSIAHELGHLFLHRDYFNSQCPVKSDDEWIRFMENMDDAVFYRLEKQADMFAGMILMPKDEIVASVNAGESLETISRKFEVSTKAARRRIKDDDVWDAINRGGDQ